ncbi:unnamed protein product [Brassica oleracea]
MDVFPADEGDGGYDEALAVEETDNDGDGGDVCRICRSSEKPDDPLRYVCACRGSNYFHEECLRLCLDRHGNKQCEVCRCSYSFVPVYSEKAPERLPCRDSLRGLSLRSVRVAAYDFPADDGDGGYDEALAAEGTDNDGDGGDVCRICRSSEKPDDPLRYVCACRGSNYFHEECLRLCLDRHGNKQCEVCRCSYSFVPVYSEKAPERLPCRDSLRGLSLRSVRVAAFPTVGTDEEHDALEDTEAANTLMAKINENLYGFWIGCYLLQVIHIMIRRTDFVLKLVLLWIQKALLFSISVLATYVSLFFVLLPFMMGRLCMVAATQLWTMLSLVIHIMIRRTDFLLKLVQLWIQKALLFSISDISNTFPRTRGNSGRTAEEEGARKRKWRSAYFQRRNIRDSLRRKIEDTDPCGAVSLHIFPASKPCMVWKVRANEPTDELASKDWTGKGGPVRNQGDHDNCWTYVTSDLCSSQRLICEEDSSFRTLSSRFLTFYVCPREREYQRKHSNRNEDHLCHGYPQLKGLEFIWDNGGIPEEEPEDATSDYSCKENPPLRNPKEKYTFAGEVDLRASNKIEDLYEWLLHQPVGADMILFSPEYENITSLDDVYEGPKADTSRNAGLHSVLVLKIAKIKGIWSALVKLSHGKERGEKGYMYISLATMIVNTRFLSDGTTSEEEDEDDSNDEDGTSNEDENDNKDDGTSNEDKDDEEDYEDEDDTSNEDENDNKDDGTSNEDKYDKEDYEDEDDEEDYEDEDGTSDEDEDDNEEDYEDEDGTSDEDEDDNEHENYEDDEGFPISRPSYLLLNFTCPVIIRYLKESLL